MMATGLLVSFVCYLFSLCNGIQGSVNVPEDKDLELENQLRIINKPAVKSIMTDYGHIYDCVDFYKQPAFDHPLLKNHSYNFQMKAQFEDTLTNVSSPGINEILHFGIKDGGCPLGTVPIKRTTKEDLIREKRLSSILETGGTHISVARSVRQSEQFTGALAFISLYNPHVESTQYSAARITLQNGNEFIQFGWMVNPALYGDNMTHLFIRTSTNSALCYDAQCGFVITRPEFSPSFAYQPQYISIIGKKIFETKLKVKKDKDGNWWLLITKNNVEVGFWPNKLFTDLSSFANYVDYGGEVYTPPGVQGPEMGSGIGPKGPHDRVAYMRWVTAVDSLGNDFNPELVVGSQGSGYTVYDHPTRDRVWGHIVDFGGKER